MPGPVIANPIPFKYRPGTESVLDDFWTRVLRRIGTITGANDPQQIMSVAGAMGIPGGEASPAAKAVQAGAQYLESKFPKLASYIKAYHASPHDFEKFDIRKVGTGQGAQAYGHGLYTAESEAVSGRGGEYDREFTEALRRKNPIRYSGGEAIPGTLEHRMLSDVADEGLEKTVQHWEHSIRGNLEYAPDQANLQRYTLDKIKQIDPRTIDAPRAKIYEVSIAAHPDQFLDWDKPLTDQPQHIQEAVKAARDKAMGDVRPVRLKDGSYGLTRINPDGSGNVIPGVSGATPEEAIAAHQKEVGYGSGQWAYDMLSRTVRKAGAFPELSIPDKAAAAQALREAGIPGIKYLDQGSRDPQKIAELTADLAQYREAAKHWAETGNAANLAIANKQIAVLEKRVQPTSNYVVFDDSLIDIMRKYGVVLPLGAGLAALSQQQQKVTK